MNQRVLMVSLVRIECRKAFYEFKIIGYLRSFRS